MKKAKIIKDSIYPEMYRVVWPDGEISDMINKTRANDAVIRYEKYERRNASK